MPSAFSTPGPRVFVHSDELDLEGAARYALLCGITRADATKSKLTSHDVFVEECSTVSPVQPIKTVVFLFHGGASLTVNPDEQQVADAGGEPAIHIQLGIEVIPETGFSVKSAHGTNDVRVHIMDATPAYDDKDERIWNGTEVEAVYLIFKTGAIVVVHPQKLRDARYSNERKKDRPFQAEVVTGCSIPMPSMKMTNTLTLPIGQPRKEVLAAPSWSTTALPLHFKTNSIPPANLTVLPQRNTWQRIKDVDWSACGDENRSVRLHVIFNGTSGRLTLRKNFTYLSWESDHGETGKIEIRYGTISESFFGKEKTIIKLSNAYVNNHTSKTVEFEVMPDTNADSVKVVLKKIAAEEDRQNTVLKDAAKHRASSKI